MWVALTFNKLVAARNNVREAWAQIDVQLAQRSDLVPQLVAAVEGYQAHEREALEAVVAARTQMVNAQGPRAAGEADTVLEGALGKLYALAEAYPDLKANTNFLDLQARLTALEEDIASARRYYNALVERFATLRQSFPNVIIAGPLGFRAAEYFKAEGDDRSTPSVAGETATS
ncbi:MAG TPA: LemA family protein [Acidimicrobiia bacterium]|nr:LemA family protein [Acidimicrobiia bacterium]